ncbi:MAG: hypothetical protein P4L69_23315 [Desulfosporosinus sp.]|nr:hypothetical protein [Desulfosporosinus sp.]
MRERYLANKEKIKAQVREYRLANKDKILAKARKYREENREFVTERKRNYVNENKEHIKEYNRKYTKSHGAIRAKLKNLRAEDDRKGREFNLTYEYVKELLQEQDNECAHCDVTVKLEWTKAYDPAQFSVNRKNNKLGHIVGNVEICCLQCNREYH